MNRRSVLLAAGTVCTGLAGCAKLEETGERLPAATGPDRPWEELPVTVTLDDRTETGREGFEELLLDGLAYWEDESEEYAGYEIEYAFEPDHDDADIVVELVEDVQTCSVEDHDREAVGCAPVIDGRAPDTATVEIKDGFSEDLTLVTIKHEFGHTLGLGHDDDPIEIMSSDPADRIPEYETRVDVHERYRETVERINDGTGRFNAGTDALEDGDWENAIEPFEDATEQYRGANEELLDLVEAAESIGAHRAVSLLTEAERYTYHYADAAESYTLMARARADGELRTTQTHEDDARDAIEAGREYDVETDGVAEALGLQ